VKVYSAVVDRTVRFHILDPRELMRVKQYMVNPYTGEEVSREEIQNGYEIGPGKLVWLTDDELKSLAPEPFAGD
jgi:non-homologous end joining protein Ku